MRPYPCDERHRQLDGEHRRRSRHRHMPGPAGALHVAMRLPRRAAEPARQLPGGIRGRHICGQQVRCRVDPLGEHISTGPTATRHVTKVLLNMSHRLR